jgi:serine/threonine protein kinase/Tol biopolymer transport system component
MPRTPVPGDRIGPYEIIETLGAGGMGVVFLAHDAQLLRTVALKIVSEDRLTHEASSQLLAEARAASALNHPGICTIHEIREEDGRLVLVMEYVDGKPLNQQIPHDGLPPDSVLRYGVQIADALAHAHDRGVLHRDLKSANVILTREGRLKVVDFGLASRFQPVGVDDATRSVKSLSGTDPLAGTLSYIAPEILEGNQPSISSDLWALGVLSYEMASGHLPFTGRTAFEISAAIIRAPTPALAPHVPASIRTIIARCLAKEPVQRYRSAGEVRAALEAVQSDATAVPLLPAPARRRTRRVRAILIAAGAVLALGAGALIWNARREHQPTVTPGIGQLRQVLSSDRQAYDPALSADGATIAYIAEDEAGQFDLYVGRVAGGRRLRITSDEAREARPRFSPDGERIAFARRRAGVPGPEICVVPALGGEISVVVSNASQPAWSPDASRLAFIRAGPGSALTLVTARVDGTEPRELLSGDGTYPFLRGPAWSPDGRHIAVVRGTGGISGEIWIVPAAGGAPEQVTDDPPSVFSHDPVFGADGRTIVHSSNRGGATNIWSFDVERRVAARLTTGSGPDESPTVDRNGRAAFLNARWRNEMSVRRPDGSAERVLVRHATFLWAPAFAPDGRTIAYSQSEVDGSWHVWIAGAKGTLPRRLTSGDLGELYPRWTADGRFVLYHTWGRPRRVWRVSRDGGAPEPVTPVDIDASFPDLSPDGATLAFAATEGNMERVYTMPLRESGRRRLLREKPASLPHWSPDGRLIAFAADRGYFGGILIIRPDGTGERQVTSTGGWPVWWPDGKRIAYVTIASSGVQEIRTVSIDGSSPDVLLPIRFEGANHPFDVARDGASLVTTNAVHVSSEVWMLEPK